MSILDLRPWKPFEFEFGPDHKVRMKVKALRGPDGGKLRAAFYTAMRSRSSNGGQPEPAEDREPTQEEMLANLASQEEVTNRWFEAFPEGFLEHVFARWIKDIEMVGEYQTEEKIDTGAKLFEIAPDGLIVKVVWAIVQASSLTAMEGKVSSSPSTSGSEAASIPGDSGASTAPITVIASEPSSTATATPN